VPFTPHVCLYVVVEAMRLFFDCGRACRGCDSALIVHGSACRVLKKMQLLTGAEQDGNINSRVMITLSLHRSTELGRC
jgi:hypothetical protein